jgi:hypothetical protein
VNETDPIHPLKDVWLRPRRVFRELKERPLGPRDYVLAAVQGIASSLFFYQIQPPEGRMDAWIIILAGPIGGLFGTLLFAFIYSRMAVRIGSKATRPQIFHVLAYSSVPLAASALIWIVTFLVLGEVPFLDKPPGDVDSFVWIVARLQFGLSVLLVFWSYLLQVMGLSEILDLKVGKSFALWALGQLVATMAMFFLVVLFAILFPQLVPAPPT